MDPSLSKRDLNRQRWRERISTWKNSSQTQKAFCEDQHVGLASFQRWRRILKTEDSEDLVTARHEIVRFLPVKVQEEKATNLTILIHDDLRIEVPTGFNPHLLQQVIQVLRAS